MTGRRSTNSPTPAGIVSSAVIRIPNEAASMKSGFERLATALAISGWNVVAIETPSRPCGRMKNVNAAK